MTSAFADVTSAAIVTFHDQRLVDYDWKHADDPSTEGAWKWIAVNHRSNVSLWEEEDQARRTDAGAESSAGETDPAVESDTLVKYTATDAAW